MLSESNRVTIIHHNRKNLSCPLIINCVLNSAGFSLNMGGNTKQTGSSEEFKIFSHSSVGSSLQQVSDLMIKVSYLFV